MEQVRKLNFYVVKTDKENPRHHGLYENTSPYVLTVSPRPGDQIEYVFPIDICDQMATLDLNSQVKASEFTQVRVRLLSHLGRNVFIGEDGAEDAIGNDAAGPLFLEILSGADWLYAPIGAEVIEPPPKPEDELTPEYDAYYQVIADHYVHAFRDAEGRWTIDQSGNTEWLMEGRHTRLRDALRAELRLQVKALSDPDFDLVKAAVLDRCSGSDQEWILRKEGRDWGWNPIACTIVKLLPSFPDLKSKEQCREFCAGEIRSLLPEQQ